MKARWEIREVAVQTIPHTHHRYPTVGDWLPSIEHERLIVRVSHMEDWRYGFLVAFHEQAEAAICARFGISDEDVSAFDIAYENRRASGDDSEPGDDPDAPYYHAHQIATQCERILAEALGVVWDKYEAAINELP